MSGLAEKAFRLLEELSKLRGDKDSLTAEDKLALELGPNISELKTSTGILVGPLPKV